MAGEGAFTVSGRVVAVLKPGLFQVELANGHQLLVYTRKRDRLEASTKNLGDEVTVAVTPYDLSKGRLRLKTRNEV